MAIPNKEEKLSPNMNKNVSIGLCNPKNPSNVGAVMRAAGCYSANAVYYTGTRFDRAAKYQLDTKKASSFIPLRSTHDLLAEVELDQKIICVELAIGAEALPGFVHPKNAFYIFGPEDDSIDQSMIDRAYAVVYIPTNGCMNLAATVNVLLYDRLAKTIQVEDHRAMVSKNRDVNNRLKVKGL